MRIYRNLVRLHFLLSEFIKRGYTLKLDSQTVTIRNFFLLHFFSVDFANGLYSRIFLFYIVHLDVCFECLIFDDIFILFQMYFYYCSMKIND